ncbi:MAG: ATP-binding protein [Polyangiales bacterium]|nr:response regulator [Sandaracinaceae bacterium]
MDSSTDTANRVSVLLVVQVQSVADALRPLLSAHQPAWNYEVSVEADSRPAETAVLAAREGFPNAPIGYLAASEVTRFDAIKAGADEAAVMLVPDSKSVSTFLDLLVLRAQLRREHAALSQTAAQNEKLAALATLVAGVGHEINNPLSAIMLSVAASQRYLQPLVDAGRAVSVASESGVGLGADDVARLSMSVTPILSREGGPAIMRVLDDIMGAAGSIASVVRDLRVFARADGEEPANLCSVPEVIDHALRLVGREFASRAIVERDYADDLPTLVLPRHRLTQVLTNLLVNAAHAMTEIERPTHRVRITARGDGDMVIISVSDTGRGVPSDQLERIFDPFFTTKREGLGTGLGLSISRSILHRLGGDLLVDSVHGEGATFMCLLPCPTPEEVRSAKHVPGQRMEVPLERPYQWSVLAVDDDERILRAYSRLLGREFRLVTARDGLEAIELLRSGTQVDAIVAEVDLPEVSGPDLLEWLAQNMPRLASRMLFVTGAQDRPPFSTFVRDHAERVLIKPVAPARLREQLERIASLRPDDAADRPSAPLDAP